MEKEFVSYTLALQLKELGFDEPCFGVFQTQENNRLVIQYFQKYSLKVATHLLPVPTFSQAFRWFREKYDIQCWLNDGGYLGKVFVKITGFKHDKFYFSSSEPMEYEEAEEACLKKLIEIVKNELQDN